MKERIWEVRFIDEAKTMNVMAVDYIDAGNSAIRKMNKFEAERITGTTISTKRHFGRLDIEDINLIAELDKE